MGEMSAMNAVPSHDQSTKRSQDLTCPRCQRGYLTDRHCKSVCELCGYVESCEDILRPSPLRDRSMTHRAGDSSGSP